MDLNKYKPAIKCYVDIIILLHELRFLQKEYLLTKSDSTLTKIRQWNKSIDDALIILSSKELNHNSIVQYFNTINNCSIADNIKNLHNTNTNEFIKSICRPHFNSFKSFNLYMFLYEKYFNNPQSVNFIKFSKYYTIIKIHIKDKKFKLYSFDLDFILHDYSIIIDNCVIFNREFI